MYELEIVFEENYKVERRAVLKLNKEQYVNWINGESKIEDILKRSHDVQDFKKNVLKEKSNFQNGCKNIKLSDYNKDFKHKQITSFDVIYINESG